MRDYFVEGQVGIRSPKQRNESHRMEKYQRRSVERLCQPSENRQVDSFIEVMNKSPSNRGMKTFRDIGYLTSSRELNATSTNNALVKSGGLVIDTMNNDPIRKRQRATQLGDIASPIKFNELKSTLLGKPQR